MELVEILIAFSAILGATTLVEIAPIKINPWSRIFKSIGKMMLGDLHEEIGELRNELTEFKKDQGDIEADTMRWSIINFANSCRRHEKHSKDAWCHAISQIAKYDDYCERKDIVNGIIDADAAYLKQLYQERCIKNDFIQ